MLRFKLFVSSPGDVALEREIARKCAQRLAHEFADRVQLESYFWEYEPMDFSAGYQPQIPRASDFDVVVCIFFSRLGTPVTIEGTTYPSGTAYELIEAKTTKEARLRAGEERGPHILVYKNRTEIRVPAIATAESVKTKWELRRLNRFLAEQTRSGNEFVGALNAYSDTAEFEEKFESKLRRLIEARVAAAGGGRADVGKSPRKKGANPYRGLFAFEFEDAPTFFGRVSATGDVIRAFQNQAAERRHRSVLIVGSSGSGKSSLARAGVAPMLVRPNVIPDVGLWRRAVMKPRDAGDLFVALAEALLHEHALPELARDAMNAERLADRLRASPDAAAEIVRGALAVAAVSEQSRRTRGLERQVAEFAAKGYANDAERRQKALQEGLPIPAGRLVLLVDQFEEVFTRKTPPTDLERFTACLRRLADGTDGPAFVIMTLAAAFQGLAAGDLNLRELTKLDGVYSLPPPTEEEFAQMIRLPALAAGIRFEVRDGVSLDERILRDARDQTDCLPLVEFCLEELTNRCRDQPELTFAEYERLGTISGVLTKQANETVARLGDGPRNAVDDVLRALISPDPSNSGAAVRRTALWQEAASTPDAEALTTALVRARLLVESETSGQRSVTVVHEALLRHWEPAKKWIGADENQEFLRRRERLERSHRTWADAPPRKRRGFLIPSGVQLAEAQDLLKRHPRAFSGMKDFVRDSVWEDRKRRVAFIALAAAAVVVAFSFYAYYSVQRVRDAKASQLLAESQRALDRSDYARAEIAAAGSLTFRDHPRARELLLRARSGGVKLVSNSFSQGEAKFSTVSRDGDYCAYVVYDAHGTPTALAVASLKDYGEKWRLDIGDVPDCVAFSERAGEREVAVAGTDHSIEIWRLAEGKPAERKRRIAPAQDAPGLPTKRIPSMAFHPTKSQLAFCSDDKRLCLWDYASEFPKLLWERTGAHGTAVHGIAFDAEGALLASGGGDYLVKVWDVAAAVKGYASEAADETSRIEPLYALEGHTDSVFAVAFSPDGRRLASGGYDRLIRIWDLENVIVPWAPPNEAERVSLEEAPSAANHPTMIALNGHTGTVLALDFSDDGTLLLSGGNDRTARLWQVIGGGALVATFDAACGDVESASLETFGDRVAFGGHLGWSQWSVSGQSGLVKLWSEGATVGALAFDAHGASIATGGSDGLVRIWTRNESGFALPERLDPDLEGEYINGLAFSPDGLWLAGAGEGATIHLWACEDNWRKLRPDYDSGRLRHDGPIWGLAFSPDSDWLASSNADEDICIKRWSVGDDWSLINRSDPAQFAVYALAIDPQERWIATADADAVLARRGVEDLKVIEPKLVTATQGETNLWSIAVCPEPLCLFTGGGDGHVYRWTPGEREASHTTSDEDATVNHVINSVSFSRRFGYVAAAGDGSSVEIYDRDLRKIFSLAGHDGTIWMVAFDPEGERLAYGGSDGFVRVWEIEKANQVLTEADPAYLYSESVRHTGLALDDAEIVAVDATP